jgi:hypothetical protein
MKGADSDHLDLCLILIFLIKERLYTLSLAMIWFVSAGPWVLRRNERPLTSLNFWGRKRGGRILGLKFCLRISEGEKERYGYSAKYISMHHHERMAKTSTALGSR